MHSQIKKAIRENKLVFFVGSGCSKDLGLPNWYRLVGIIADNLRDDYPQFENIYQDILHNRTIDEIDALEEMAKIAKNRVFTVLKNTIETNLVGKDLYRHAQLWSITNQIITTNYDKALDVVMPDSARMITQFNEFHLANSMNEGYLFKVHGDIDYPADCILIKEQYEELYSDDFSSGAIIRLFQTFTDKTIVFIGFSLKDPYVNKLLELRQKVFRGFTNPHFIITTEDKDFSSLGVERIPITNNHVDVEKILNEWLAYKATH